MYLNWGAAMLDFWATLIIGGVFGFILFKLKFPGGMIVGSIMGVSLLNIFTGHALMPANARLAAQIVAGAYIGVTVNKSDLKRLKKLAGPAITLLLGMFGLNLLSGYLIYLFSPLDLLTSLMCAVPGGMSDTPIISAEMGADASKVAVLQFVRLVAGIGIFPVMIGLIARNKQESTSPIVKVAKAGSSNRKIGFDFFKTMSVAIIVGLIGKKTGIPAGALLFSLLGVLTLKIATNSAWLPKWLKRVAQVLSGAYIGSSVEYADVIEIRYLAVPAVILVTGYIVLCILLGFFIHKRFNMSLREAMLSVTPAGATDMALIASDLGIQSTDVVVLQIVRLVFVITVFPQVIRLIVIFSGR